MRTLATCTLVTSVSFWQTSVYASPGVRQLRNVYELPTDAIARKPYEETPSEDETELGLVRFLEGDFSMSMPSPGGGSTPPSTGGSGGGNPTPAPVSGQVPTLGSAQPAATPTKPTDPPTAAPVSTPSSGSNPTPAPVFQPAESPTPAPLSTPTSGSQPVGPPTPMSQPVGPPTQTSQPVAPPTPVSQPIEPPTSASQPVGPPTQTSQPVAPPTPVSQPIEPPTPASQSVGPPTQTSQPVEPPTPASQPVEPPTPAEPTPPTGEGEIPGSEDTSIGCADVDSESTYVTFTYEMETMPDPTEPGVSVIQEQEVQKNLEIALNEALASKLLECQDVRSRRLQGQDSDVGTVQFDYLPKDAPAEDPNCSLLDPASTNVCYKLEGVMQVSYKPGSDHEIIEYVVRSTTKTFLNSAKNPQVPGLARATYVGPDITTPPGIRDDDETPSTGEPVDASTLSNKNILFMSLASVGFVVAVGVATYFRVRKSARLDEVPYVATLENESSADESHQSQSGDDIVSPFSTMLPSAYRLDSPLSSINTSEMGTIPESDVSDGQSSGILLSEGYSTGEESDVELPFYENPYMTPVAPVLGARPRSNEELENAI